MKIKRIIVAATAAAGLTLTMAACTVTSSTSSESGVHGSRAEFYGSVGELADASSLVVRGTVAEQTVASDITPDLPFTLSTFDIQEVLEGEGAVAGTQVTVRQIGIEYEVDAPAPLLEVGQEYLLFLTPSGLDAPLDVHFYVTGGNAGLYASAADATARRGGEIAFTQVEASEEDDLPAEILPAEITG
jgi:hypothetical protein